MSAMRSVAHAAGTDDRVQQMALSVEPPEVVVGMIAKLKPAAVVSDDICDEQARAPLLGHHRTADESMRLRRSPFPCPPSTIQFRHDSNRPPPPVLGALAR